jgi:hypothetical protein
MTNKTKITKILGFFAVIFLGVVCGFALTSIVIPFYFNNFPPIAGKLTPFYVSITIFIIALIALGLALMKKKKYLTVLWVGVTWICFIAFFIPIFMAENNHHLADQIDIREGVDPAKPIPFTKAESSILFFLYGLYTVIWLKIWWISYIYITLFVVIKLYLIRRALNAR